MSGAFYRRSAVLGLVLMGVAWAEDWTAYPALFPTVPCGDGWSGCVVNGTPITAGTAKDSSGRPLPSNARFNWWDLSPTAALSPFEHLSTYSGAVGGVVATPPPPVEPPPSRPPEQVATNNSSNGRVDPPQETRPLTPPPQETRPVTPPQETRPVTPPPQTNTQPVTPPPQNNTTVAANNTKPPNNTQPVTPPPQTNTQPATPPPQNNTAKTTNPSQATPPPTPPATVVAVSDNCDDLSVLEPSALMGQLTKGQMACLENRIGTEPAQTTRDKVSRLLINNAYAKGDKVAWEKLVQRHLESIDRSDPDMCYNYALQLSRGGVGRASGVIRWADYALENKSRWTGNTYKTRVFSLYKLKAEAAAKLWQDASNKFTQDRSDENSAAAEKYRGWAKEYAKEWLDYARASAQDSSTAMALCVSAAGNASYCGG